MRSFMILQICGKQLWVLELASQWEFPSDMASRAAWRATPSLSKKLCSKVGKRADVAATIFYFFRMCLLIQDYEFPEIAVEL